MINLTQAKQSTKSIFN